MLPDLSSFKRAFILLSLIGIAVSISGCASREERIQNVQAEANEALFQDNSAKAINLLSEGLAKYPDSNELRIALARALRNAGKLEEAAAHYEAAIKQDPDADQLWVKVGEIRSSLGQSLESIRAFEEYLKNHAGDFLAWKTVALENAKIGKLTDAIKAANKWNEITPSSQPSLKIGELYLLSNNTAQARSWFSQAAAYGDKYAAKDAFAELIKLETSLSQLEQAQIWLEQYEQRYGTNSNDPRIQESKTVLESWERARREIAEAAAALEREREQLETDRLAEEKAEADRQANELAAALNPSAPDSPTSGGDTLAQNDEQADLDANAPTLFEDDDSGSSAPESQIESSAGGELELSPYETAVTAYENSDFETAISILWELLGETPEDAEVWYRLSLALSAQGNWYDAENTILQAKSLAPRSEVIAQQYLLTLLKTQNTTRALEEIKAHRLLFPRSPAIALTLAQTLRNANAPRSIVTAAYRDFLSLAPRGEPGYQEANRYLQNGN